MLFTPWLTRTLLPGIFLASYEGNKIQTSVFVVRGYGDLFSAKFKTIRYSYDLTMDDQEEDRICLSTHEFMAVLNSVLLFSYPLHFLVEF
jgi:hypothetical protein